MFIKIHASMRQTKLFKNLSISQKIHSLCLNFRYSSMIGSRHLDQLIGKRIYCSTIPNNKPKTDVQLYMY